MPPYGGKAGEADIRQQRLSGPQPVEKIPGPEQQQPRQQGKIVRGHEARAGKAQPRREKICVPAPRQHKYRNPGKAEKPVIEVPHQQKQAERTGQPQPGRNAVQPPPQRHGQQHAVPRNVSTPKRHGSSGIASAVTRDTASPAAFQGRIKRSSCKPAGSMVKL